MIPRCRERLPDVELTLKEMVTTDQYTSQIHSTLALVRGGLGTALAPEAAMSLRFDGVVCRPLRRAHSAPAVELYMAWKKEDDNPARRSVLDTCLQHCQSAALTRPR